MTPQAAVTAIQVVCDRVEATGAHRTELLLGIRNVLNAVDPIGAADEYSRGYADGRRAPLRLTEQELAIVVDAMNAAASACYSRAFGAEVEELATRISGTTGVHA